MMVDITSICYNESHLLPMWIESWSSIPWINKINLIDGGSTDGSVEIARSYDGVTVLEVKWMNDFSRQRNIAIKLAKSEWLLQADIDELPICNLQDPRIEKLLTNSHDLIQLPYIKFFDWNKLWFFKNGSTPSITGDTITSGYKSTLNIYRKGVLKGYSKSLHEEPLATATNPYIFQPHTTLDELPNTFMVGHMDQAKAFEQAYCQETSLELQLGLKRIRYRFITPAIYEGKIYDQAWAAAAWSAHLKGNSSIIEELGGAQLRAFQSQHTILEGCNAFALLSDPVKQKCHI